MALGNIYKNEMKIVSQNSERNCTKLEDFFANQLPFVCFLSVYTVHLVLILLCTSKTEKKHLSLLIYITIIVTQY